MKKITLVLGTCWCVGLSLAACGDDGGSTIDDGTNGTATNSDMGSSDSTGANAGGTDQSGNTDGANNTGDMTNTNDGTPDGGGEAINDNNGQNTPEADGGLPFDLPPNDEACPGTAPADEAACETGGGGFLNCSYEGDSSIINCTCSQFGNQGDPNWNCNEININDNNNGFNNGGNDACPDTVPEDNSACEGNLFCGFPDDQAFCRCQGEQWQCNQFNQ